MKRAPPSVRMKEEVEVLLRGGDEADVPADAPMDGFVRTTACYMLEVAIEADASALGRGHHRRGERARAGWRRGHPISRRWCAGCMSAGSRRRMSVRCTARRSARRG